MCDCPHITPLMVVIHLIREERIWDSSIQHLCECAAEAVVRQRLLGTLH
jgi:hypothetical protein